MAEVDTSVEAQSSSEEEPKIPAPFSEPDEMTDIAFVVEEKKIHFNKTLLAMSSSVFKRMLFGDFAEKDAKEIPLPGKKYNDVVAFFTQIHPAYVFEVTDDTLLGLLALSTEYQVQSVRSKCQQYLEHMTTKAERDNHKKTVWTADKLLLYVFACGEYDFKQFLPRLVNLVAKQPSKEITGCDVFNSRPSMVYLKVLKSRCANLEQVLGKVRFSASEATTAADILQLNGSNCSYNHNTNKCCKSCVALYLRNELASINERTSSLAL